MVRNADIAAVFESIADLLDLAGDNAFRIRAYRNAARTIAACREDLPGLVACGRELPKLPGIGPDLGGKIREIAATGTCELAERLRRRFPPGLPRLLELPGLGPRRVRTLFDALHVDSIDTLRRCAESGQVRRVAGFGEATQRRILQAIEHTGAQVRRFLRPEATRHAEAIVAHLASGAGVDRVVVAGSARRLRETVGDLDILVTARARAAAVMERFCSYSDVREVLSRGRTRAAVRLACGLQVDLRLVPAESFGAALHYFTGSKAHNVAIRRLGQARGLKISEYGVFRGAVRIAGETEESVFHAVGLPWIPPELREDRGEIEAARAHRLPVLVERSDLRGDLHVHTLASDGRDGIREMALAARAAGLQYIAVTDHSTSLTVARGLDPARLEQHLAAIDRVNADLDGIVVLKGAEVDILEDGRLDYPDALLAKLDIVVGAVHGRFDLPRERQTARVLRALDHPSLAILAHPAGRLLGTRQALDIDLAQVVAKASARGRVLELNAQPDRLDLDDEACRLARSHGVAIAIGSDAHSAAGYGVLDLGIGQARRGWLAARDVFNTRPLPELRRALAAMRRVRGP